MDTIPQDTPQDKPVYIYTLSSPSDPEKIRYVGKTIAPQRRMYQHSNNKSNTHRGNWIASLRTQGFVPIMTIIEETSSDKWKEREIFWVAFYKNQGHDLTNATEGGDGSELSPESKAKISAAAKSRKRGPFSEEHRRKLGDVSRGKKQSPEWVAKRTAMRKGSKHTTETKAKMSDMRKGKPLSPEHKAKVIATQSTPEFKEKQSASRRGRKATPETRAKISASGRGRKQSPESIAKTSAANRGTKRSPETRAKISAAKKNMTPETKAKISASLTGKKLSPESIKKRSDTVRGRKRPPEVVAKVSATKTGTKRPPFSEEWKQNLGNSMRGKRHSPESIARMSEARKRWHAMKKNPPEQLGLWN